jgi:hypothetical protein
VGVLCVGTVDYQTNARCSLKMRLTAVIFEYEGLNSRLLKQLLSHSGLNFVGEDPKNDRFFRQRVCSSISMPSRVGVYSVTFTE